LFDFNPSPHSYKYYGVVELRELFGRFGFNVKFYGYMDVRSVSMRQRILRPVKSLAVMLGVMPKTTAGKKWLKRIVFGGLVKMPAEIGPQITQISADYEMEEKNQQITPQRNSPDQSGIPPRYDGAHLPWLNTLRCHSREFHRARRGRQGKRR